MNESSSKLHDAIHGEPIIVKFLLKNRLADDTPWRRQLPDIAPRFGRCTFTSDPDCRAYDWLAVYDELPTTGESLACPPEHTILVTVEPSSIKVYGRAYVIQFCAVLTSH